MTAATESRLRSLDVLLDGVQVDNAFASDLFAVVDALESSPALRRAVTDPGAPEGARKALVHGLLQGRVSEPVITFVGVAAEMRWAGGRTFAAALDRQAVRAELAAAEQVRTLDETEDELFRFARTVEANPDLRNALADRSVPVDKRADLVGELLGGRASDSTVRLAKRAVHARERTFAHTIEGYVTLAAAQKNRVVATVRVATALSNDQRDRLRSALTKQVGREVAVQEIIDPSVLGGVRVEFGDEVIEGTVASRLDEARRLFG